MKIKPSEFEKSWEKDLEKRRVLEPDKLENSKGWDWEKLLEIFIDNSVTGPEKGDDIVSLHTSDIKSFISSLLQSEREKVADEIDEIIKLYDKAGFTLNKEIANHIKAKLKQI